MGDCSPKPHFPTGGKPKEINARIGRRPEYFFSATPIHELRQRKILVKIRRVKVAELRRKSTKGRKWEILAPAGL
jgi:hypothetical protein